MVYTSLPATIMITLLLSTINVASTYLRHTSTPDHVRSSVRELFMPLHDPFGRFPPGNPNLSLFGFPHLVVQRE